MFKIGDFSRICRVPVSALRYYADIGLLVPSQVDAGSGYRYYTLDQLPRLHRILALKDLGLSLDEINRVLNQPLEPAEIRGMLRIKETELESELEDTQARLARVRVRLRQIEHEDRLPKQEVILKSVEPMRILSRRETIALPKEVETLFRESGPALDGVQLAGPPFTIFHDDEFYDENLDVEIAFPVDGVEVGTEYQVDTGKLTASHLEGIETAASVIHVGSYDAFLETYTTLGHWIAGNKFKIIGPAREIYLRPASEDEPALTEIQFPLETES